MNANLYTALFIVSTLFIGCSQSVSPEVEKEFQKPFQALRIDTLPAMNIRGTDWKEDAYNQDLVLGWYIRESKTGKLFRVSDIDPRWEHEFGVFSTWIESTSPDKQGRYNFFQDGLFPPALVDVSGYYPMEGSDIQMMITGESLRLSLRYDSIIGDSVISFVSKYYSRPGSDIESD